jgi:adenosylhomocysteine nucleosidase
MTECPKLAIIAALPREIAPLVGKLDPTLQPEPKLKQQGIWLYSHPAVVIVAAGMGARRATLAVGAALQAQPRCETLISAGLAGGCEPSLAAGEVLEPRSVVDVNTGERFQAQQGSTPLMASADMIAGVAEKQRLFTTYGAEAVDMEAASVARLAQARGLRFRMVKAISDPFDFEMEALNRFADVRGQFRTAAFALHTALRPHTWRHAITLGRNSSLALTALTDRLMERIAGAA